MTATRFFSDNAATVHPAVMDALVAANHVDTAYDGDALSQSLDAAFSDLFETDCEVVWVSTGTAANSIILAHFVRPWQGILCYEEAHIEVDECGAPTFYSGGATLMPLPGRGAKIDTAALKARIAGIRQDVHQVQPAAVSITNATEYGLAWRPQEIGEISEIAKRKGLKLHMDGARFANALVALDASPAEMTWKSGVDIVSFGGTKNGCWCAEAVVMFDLDQAKEFGFIRKRAAQLFSKSRFIAAQFDAYFEDGLWLETAAHSNAMSARLAGHIRASKKVRLAWEPQANEVFAVMPAKVAEALQEKGARFYDWHMPAGFGGDIEPGEKLWRFVTSFATSADEVDRFGELIA